MCGICGVINFNSDRVLKFQIENMMADLRHRGPDDEGTYIEGNVGLGFVRLSIIDLSLNGHQPMTCQNDRYVIIYNGEVYNYKEIKLVLQNKGYKFVSNTDTEVVLYSYIEWGKEFLNRLNGMFAFAIYDKYKKHMFLARDRFGVKPLYYHKDNNRLIFSSEPKPILSLLGKNYWSIDNQSMFDYLVFDRIDHTENTFFENIKKLPHSHYLEIIGSKVSKAKWYELRDNINNPFQNPEDYLNTLSNAINMTLRSDVPIGVTLSGGLDSSTIVSILTKIYKMEDIHTFSAVYGEDSVGDESKYIKELNSYLKYMYYIQPTGNSLNDDLENFIAAHGEPVPRTGPYAQFKVMQLASKYVKVTLDGQGADEVLAGYHNLYGVYYKELLSKLDLVGLVREIFSYINLHNSFRTVSSFAYHLSSAKKKTKLHYSQMTTCDKEFFLTYFRNSKVPDLVLSAKSLNDSLIRMVDNKLEHLLKWGDRNSMWFSIESRVPFLDHVLVERTLATSPREKIFLGQNKFILREAMKGILPEKIRNRKDKVGFGTPEAEWFRADPLKNIVSNIINSEHFKQSPYLNEKKAKTIYSEHLARKANHSREIWKWINIYYWQNQVLN
jgi:asparagine synthase (glutamine-hydrolysing)